MLAGRYRIEKCREIIPAYGEWHPYPRIGERDSWLGLSTALREVIVNQGEQVLDYNWPALPATLFLEYKRNGNRSRYQDVSFKRRQVLRDLVLAECMEYKSRFLDQIANAIWMICEETYWGVPAHINMQAAGVDLPDAAEPTVDLFAAETAALLAWVDYLLADSLYAVSPLLRTRITNEIQRRILEPCLMRDDFWWMGFHPGQHGVNNWNPWVNSNWLAAVLLLEQNPERRTAAVHKILTSLDVFIGTYADSGGCDEGPDYWGRAAASLFDCLDQLYSASDGIINIFQEERIKNMGRFIYRAHIGDSYYVNYADASVINHPSASLVYRYGQAIEDVEMMRFGSWLAQDGEYHKPGYDSLSRELPRLFILDEMRSTPPKAPLPQTYYFTGIQVMIARNRSGNSSGIFLSAKGGHNAESHNHNDVGNFIVFVDGAPVIVDAGVETYTKKTFSDQRYDIWTMQSAYHSLLPTLDGIQQQPGKSFSAQDVAYRTDGIQTQFTLDLAGAYPASAGLESMQRTWTHQSGAGVEICDILVFNKLIGEIVLSLLTPCQVNLDQMGVIDFQPVTYTGSYVSGQA
ncbi:MAG: heparinase II/III family protein, partial [Anaerolineae bacterium]|nr:heparinase II/III family protein [Anaerolineae bacterium]